MSIHPYVCMRIYDPTLPQIMWAVLSPFPSKRGRFPLLRFDKTQFFLKLSMISWGQFYVTERFCDFFKRHNLLIKLQPWLMLLWTTSVLVFNDFKSTEVTFYLLLQEMLLVGTFSFLNLIAFILKTFSLSL